MSASRLLALPPGAPFAEAFADGFHVRHAEQAPEVIARTLILVNTTLAMRSLEEALADRAPRPGPLPRIMLMSELHADPLEQPDLPPSIAPLRRRLRLTRLVERFLATTRRAGESIAPMTAAADLADALALLMDQFHDEGLAPDTLDQAIAESDLTAEAARHWAKTLRFVDIIRDVWPRILAEEEGGALDPRARQRAVVDGMAARWAESPPDHPVIAAASTGSVGSTAVLLAAVARLDQGAVVLPGFDRQTDADIWDAIQADHPYGPFQTLFAQLKARPSNVGDWTPVEAMPRRTLMAQALRPAPVTDHWHRSGPQLSAEAPSATEGLTLIEAESQRFEADAIAVAIREAIEQPGRTVTLVTPDAALARRVIAALDHFQLVPDDTMGQPLAQSPPGVLLRLVVEAALGRADPVGLAGLLQHPLVRPGCARTLHLDHARKYERKVLRKLSTPTDGRLLPAWPVAEDEEANWLARIEEALTPLAHGLASNAPLGDLIAAHRDALGELTDAGDEKGSVIWAENSDAGPDLQAFLRILADQVDAFGSEPVTDYPALLGALLRGEQMRPKPRAHHPRVSICGPREARMVSADLVILAGLNDGIWPAAPDPGPWLSRPMREALGLPLPERSVGLSAHDFLNAICRPEVLLTRSRKADGAATVPSRWLIRLETLLKGIGAEAAWQAMQDRGARIEGIATLLGAPEQETPRAERPAPTPPLEARPRRLPVTGIETLIRDAYAVYARYVLRLRPLDPLGRLPDARDRGTIMHQVLEMFIAQSDPWPGLDPAREMLEAIADDVLGREVPWPDLRRTWRARIIRFADWFVKREDARRDLGEPKGLERDGNLVLDLPGGPFELTAKADRIDLLQDGSAAIYDYKTGSMPTTKTIRVGLHHQLHVQAAILAQGGFRDIASYNASIGAYIGLSGSGAGGTEVSPKNLAAETPEHVAQLIQLLSAYDAGTVYLSRGRMKSTRDHSDYDHLARFGEWAGEDDE